MPFQPIRIADVVCIKDREIFPATGGDRAIVADSRSLVLLADARDARIIETANALQRAVGGAVVDDDQLPVVERLPQYALDRISDVYFSAL